MLDALPPLVRHLVLMLAACLLAWAASDVVPWLQGQGGLAAAVGAFLVAALAVLTPLTRQYGIGARRPDVTAREVLR